VDRDKVQSMLTDARAELETAKTTVVYLGQVINGLEGLLRTSPKPPSPTLTLPAATSSVGAEDDSPLDETTDGQQRQYLRTPEAILEVLQARPNFPMPFRQIWDELVRRDLVDPSLKSGRNSYTVAARRLAENPRSRVSRDEQDRYVYRTAPQESVTEGAPEPSDRADELALSPE
jgi:hypothetical protein